MNGRKYFYDEPEAQSCPGKRTKRALCHGVVSRPPKPYERQSLRHDASFNPHEALAAKHWKQSTASAANHCWSRSLLPFGKGSTSRHRVAVQTDLSQSTLSSAGACVGKNWGDHAPPEIEDSRRRMRTRSSCATTLMAVPVEDKEWMDLWPTPQQQQTWKIGRRLRVLLAGAPPMLLHSLGYFFSFSSSCCSLRYAAAIASADRAIRPEARQRTLSNFLRSQTCGTAWTVARLRLEMEVWVAEFS